MIGTSVFVDFSQILRTGREHNDEAGRSRGKDQLISIPGDHQVLVGCDDANETSAVVGADRVGIGVISFAIELDTEVLQAATGLPIAPGQRVRRCRP